MDTLVDVPLRAYCTRRHERAGAVREQLATHDAARGALLDALLAADVGRGVAVLGTCSRLELYVTPHERGEEPWPAVRDALVATFGHDAVRDDDWLARRGADAVAHLFRATCGLDSPILGDVQVLGQVRGAFAEAQARAALDPFLYEVFRRALRLGKWARHTTAIAAGGAGVGTAVCETIVARRGTAAVTARVLVVGAGDASAAVLRALVARGFGDITVLNRSTDRAVALAAQLSSTHAGHQGVRVRPFDELSMELARADVVVAAVPELPCPEDADRPDPGAPAVPRLVIDVARPRSTDPEMHGEIVLLDELVDRPSPARLAAVPAVRDACDQATRAMVAWVARRDVDGALRALYRDMDAMVDRMVHRLDATPADGIDRELRRQVRAALHPHVEALRRLTTDLAMAGASNGHVTTTGGA